MKVNVSIILTVLLLIGVGCEKYDAVDCIPEKNMTTTSLVTSEIAEQISMTVCNTMNENELIGIQLSIVDSIGEKWSLSIGSTDVKQKDQLENYHVFRIGSVTKIYTATLVLKLIEKGFLQLDQNLSEFYPSFKDAEKIQVKHLLDHSSGIKDIFSIPSIFISSSSFPDKKWNPNRLAEECLQHNLGFEPGSKHAYSNTNFILLGLIAEEATGKKLPELYNEYMFNPLGLENTFFVPYEPHPVEMSNGYVHHFALSLSEWYTNEPDNTSWSTAGFSAGALASNASDVSSFTYQLFRGNVLTRNSLNTMTDFSDKNGLGLFKISVNGSFYWGHEGEITGFEAITAYHPERKVVISICCNTTPFNIYILLEKIDSILF